MVYLREIEGRPVAFGHQGAVWSDAMTLYDHLTGSVWSQPLGAPIMGELSDIELEILPSTMTTWRAWRDLHPDTVAYVWDDPSYSDWSADSDSLDESSIVASYFEDTAAYPIPDLREVGVVNDVVGGVPIAVVMDPVHESAWQIFSRELPDGTTVELELDESRSLRDAASGATWELAYGRATAADANGPDLVILPGSTIFTDQFLDYYPQGRLWRP